MEVGEKKKIGELILGRSDRNPPAPFYVCLKTEDRPDAYVHDDGQLRGSVFGPGGYTGYFACEHDARAALDLFFRTLPEYTAGRRGKPVKIK